MLDDDLRAGLQVPEGRDRLGLAHQLRVDIAIALSLAPGWLRRAIGDKDVAKAQSARIAVVERIAAAIECRFRITWAGADDGQENARPVECASPLFGGPDQAQAPPNKQIDEKGGVEHKANNPSVGVV